MVAMECSKFALEHEVGRLKVISSNEIVCSNFILPSMKYIVRSAPQSLAESLV